MPVLPMAPTLGDLLKYELNANYCRETVTLKAGTNYALGSTLGKITASGKYRLSPAAQVTGDEGAETAVAVLLEAVDASAGNGTIVRCAVDPPMIVTAKINDAATTPRGSSSGAVLARLQRRCARRSSSSRRLPSSWSASIG